MNDSFEFTVKDKGFLGFKKKRTLGIMFNMQTWFRFWERFGWDMDYINTLPKEQIMDIFIFLGSVVYCKENTIKIDYTEEQFLKWVDQLSRGDLKEIANYYLESSKVLEPIVEKMAGKDVKKK